ncbi:MAG: 23S rRNA (pseudouridine(1915)-N(3))-methyltransferase RlmH, partial [Synergistaceae bacterium]|nr:23S rRNA (pseudouridine(1915)-N(3))-methyltransferase RlmH [Synergistaceae bacterium]
MRPWFEKPAFRRRRPYGLMPKVVVLSVGRVKDKRIASLSREYLERIQPSGVVSAEHIPDRAGSPEDRREREGQEMLKVLRPRDRLLLLREDGEERDSVGFADLLSQEMESAAGRVVLAIGGPWGISSAVKNRADKGVALSRMTFPHEMCFLFLAEQLYRAFSILRSSGYHH